MNNFFEFKRNNIFGIKKRVFGYDQLREGQLEAVEAYLSDKDMLVSIKQEEVNHFVIHSVHYFLME